MIVNKTEKLALDFVRTKFENGKNKFKAQRLELGIKK